MSSSQKVTPQYAADYRHWCWVQVFIHDPDGSMIEVTRRNFPVIVFTLCMVVALQMSVAMETRHACF